MAAIKAKDQPPGGDTFASRAKRVIRKIPRGKVATYGQIAALAGNHRAARQVVRILHSSSDKDRLPWHRVINSKGGISLARGQGYELQRAMLRQEGIRFQDNDLIDLDRFQWVPRRIRI
ncbi:MAG: MGMT family protein [Candidatus Zixiibacteriota bacterium]|nr:MAG: MGMT family protein [candidate division Zixibacteria bacterium]